MPIIIMEPLVHTRMLISCSNMISKLKPSFIDMHYSFTAMREHANSVSIDDGTVKDSLISQLGKKNWITEKLFNWQDY